MGIEHAQTSTLERYAFAPTPGCAPDVVPGDAEYKGTDYTPNQWANKVAIQLARARSTRDPAALAAAWEAVDRHFSAQLAFGHQATSAGGYGSEAGCCDPHSKLWWLPEASILRDARALGYGGLLTLATDWFAAQIALCLTFWTAQGVRVAGSRATPATGKPLRPNWAIASLGTALITGRLAPAIYHGSRNDSALAVLRQSVDLWPRIAARAASIRPRLMIPVARYDLPDGAMAAAQTREVAQNDRLSWIACAPDGSVTAASNTLVGFEPPLARPTVIFGDGSPSAPPPARSAAVGAPQQPVADVRQSQLADRLDALTLSHKDGDRRSLAVTALRSGPLDRAKLTSAADVVVALGINPDTPQGPLQRSIVDDLRQLAAERT